MSAEHEALVFAALSPDATGGTGFSEGRMARKDGTPITVEVHARTLIRGAREIRFTAIGDILRLR